MQPVSTLPKRRKRIRRWPLVFLLLILFYFFAPLRTNILLLGTDDSPEHGSLGRTDTIILATVVPLKPYVGMLSIPRDLWVSIPHVESSASIPRISLPRRIKRAQERMLRCKPSVTILGYRFIITQSSICWV